TSWRGPLMRALGGIPVDRSAPSRVVEEVVARAHAGEVFGLVVTPDGTRGPHTRWRSGFHRIARATGMPVVLGYVDRTTMTTGLGPTLDPTDDLRADMDRIRAFYADKSGYRPSQRVEPRLREEGGGPSGPDGTPGTGDGPGRLRPFRRTGPGNAFRAAGPVPPAGRAPQERTGCGSSPVSAARRRDRISQSTISRRNTPPARRPPTRSLTQCQPMRKETITELTAIATTTHLRIRTRRSEAPV